MQQERAGENERCEKEESFAEEKSKSACSYQNNVTSESNAEDNLLDSPEETIDENVD